MNDRFDLKLFLLRIIRKFHVLLLGTAIGALLVGGGYLVVKIVFIAPSYQMRVVVHENLHYNDELGQFTYINGYTWTEFVGTDVVAGAVASQLGGGRTKEQIAPMLSAELQSDTRVVYFYVTGRSQGEVSTVTDAVIPAILKVGETLPEIEDMLIMDVSTQPYVVNRIPYAGNAFILGTILGFVLTFFILSLYVIADDSVYIPGLFERKYDIPMKVSKADAPGEALVVGRKLPDLSGIKPDSDTDIYIVSGAHNGALIDKVLFDLKQMNASPKQAYLLKPVEWLIRGYYAGTAFPNPFLKD